MANNNGNTNLFSPTSPTRTFRAKRLMAYVKSLVFVFILFTMLVFIGNSRIHYSSVWLKNVLFNIPPPDFPNDLLTADNVSIIHARSTPPRESENVTKLGYLKNSSEIEHGSCNVSSNVDSTVEALVGGGQNESRGDRGTELGRKGNGSSNDRKKKKKKERKGEGRKAKSWLDMMSECDIYDGKWVRDNSPPLYQRGSCPHMDESFDCYQNGRADFGHEKFRWKPNRCRIPRLDGRKMLRFFRGKRIVYVGDSLNRNMWDSMVCILVNSVRNKSRVFEATGRQDLKKEGKYSFVFQDYDFTVEYIRSAFLVQEWEMPLGNGSKKETLRLDLVENSYDTYTDADVLVFNTGNWWTHEKTCEGKGYYQEGNHVHKKLDVVEAFDRAMNTWARWVQNNINPMKTDVFFRGYSFSHFSKGEWNTGGRCDSKEPITDPKDLLNLDELSPPIPQMLDRTMERIKYPVLYINVTRMTNYRQDAHPSLFRKPNMTREEKRDFLTHQDCSHWCLPGVPDTWNQLMFAQLLLSHKHRHRKQRNYKT